MAFGIQKYLFSTAVTVDILMFYILKSIGINNNFESNSNATPHGGVSICFY